MCIVLATSNRAVTRLNRELHTFQRQSPLCQTGPTCGGNDCFACLFLRPSDSPCYASLLLALFLHLSASLPTSTTTFLQGWLPHASWLSVSTTVVEANASLVRAVECSAFESYFSACLQEQLGSAAWPTIRTHGGKEEVGDNRVMQAKSGRFTLDGGMSRGHADSVQGKCRS